MHQQHSSFQALGGGHSLRSESLQPSQGTASGGSSSGLNAASSSPPRIPQPVPSSTAIEGVVQDAAAVALRWHHEQQLFGNSVPQTPLCEYTSAVRDSAHSSMRRLPDVPPATQGHDSHPATSLRTVPSSPASTAGHHRMASRLRGSNDDDGETDGDEASAQGQPQRRQLCFASSASGQRMKQQFSVSANSLASLYKEASQAYAMGVHDARDDIHRYVLDALQSVGATAVSGSVPTATPSAALSSSSGGRPLRWGDTRGVGNAPNRGGTTGSPQLPAASSSTALRRNRRWIDADELLAYLCLATLQVEPPATSSTTGTAACGHGGDVPHTFGRRRPRDSSPSGEGCYDEAPTTRCLDEHGAEEQDVVFGARMDVRGTYRGGSHPRGGSRR